MTMCFLPRCIIQEGIRATKTKQFDLTAMASQHDYDILNAH